MCGRNPPADTFPRGELGPLTSAGSVALVPDPKCVGSPRWREVHPGPRGIDTFALSFGQSLEEGRLFGLDFAEAGIQLCHPLPGGRPLRGAPCLLDFQARDLHVRPVGKTDAVHATGKRTNRL